MRLGWTHAAERVERADGQVMHSGRDGGGPRPPGNGSGHGGWIAEQRWGPHNDWAPNIAADPSSSWLYQMTTQYGGHRVCRPHRNTASRSDPRRTGPGRAEHRAAAGARRGPVPRCYLLAQIAYARGAYV